MVWTVNPLKAETSSFNVCFLKKDQFPKRLSQSFLLGKWHHYLLSSLSQKSNSKPELFSFLQPYIICQQSKHSHVYLTSVKHPPCDPYPVLTLNVAVISSHSFSHAGPFSSQVSPLRCPPLPPHLKSSLSLLMSPCFISPISYMVTKYILALGKSGKCRII